MLPKIFPDSMLLTAITFVPVVGMVIVLGLPNNAHKTIRAVTALTTGFVFYLTLALWFGYNSLVPGYAFEVSVPWIAQYNINYTMGVDGLSVVLIMLTGLLSFLATFSAFNIEKGVKGFFALYLLLVTGMLGVFCSLDFFLFYVFWEVMLLPMYFLIGVWGGPRREYAAIKFFIYTLLGSVFMLVVILVCYFKTGSFSIPELIALQPFAGSRFWVQELAFFALFVAFAIKVPIFPFHTWLPDAHVEAPTSISVILAGILLKMGGYGFLRINWPLLKDVATAPHIIYFMIVLALINIIYGALCAMAQSDFKKLVAYSSVSHMGYVLLGIAVLQTEAVNGAIFQMFAHGLSSAMLFLLVGVVYERAHHREIARFGGLGLKMPVYLTLSIVGFFASLGLPGMVGFIGEVMVFLGAFRAADGAYRIQTLIATLGILLTAAYILWTMQRVYLGKLKPEYEEFSDVNKVELITLVPLAILCILFGVLPNLLLSVFSQSTETWLSLMGR